MRKNKKSDKPLKIIEINIPTKEKADEIIEKISKNIKILYSNNERKIEL